MATPKHATVTKIDAVAAGTRLIELATKEPLEFTGGQYVIVDSGRVLESGKAAKRAYSLCSSDAEPQRIRLAVKRIAGGLCSGFMHELTVGTEIRFSGPWGKFFPKSDAEGETLVLATDTGVSAALGLICGRRFEPLLEHTTFVWLRASEEDFLPHTLVRACIPRRCREVRIDWIAPIGHPERVPHARSVLATLLAQSRPRQAFLCGDGAVNYTLRDDLTAAGVTATRDNVESFFNMPKKTATRTAPGA